MKSRWFTRGLFVSVALASSVALAACARPDAPTEGASQGVTAQADAPQEDARGPGYRIFRQIDSLDLTEDQREDLSGIEADLRSDLEAHRGTVQKVADTLAHGVETGQLDEALARECQEALARTVADGRISITRAINDVHDVLDADQREELVAAFRKQREAMRTGADDGHRRGEGLTKLAATLGLSDQQKQAIRDGIQAQVDKVFPDRKARRDAWEAKMQALGDAFQEDDFDAADFDIGGEADEAIARFTSTAKQAIDFSGGVLTPTQRAMLASLIRDRAAAFHHR